MIEIHSTKRGQPSEPQILINGEVITSAYYSDDTIGKRRKSLQVTIPRSHADAIFKHTLDEIPYEISFLSVGIDIEWFLGNVEVELQRDDKLFEKIEFAFTPSISRWKGVYTFEEYLTEFHVHAKLKGWDIIEGWAPGEIESRNMFYVLINLNPEPRLIGELVNKYLPEIRQVHETTHEALLSNIHKDSVVLQFDFPEQVRTTCEQYLLYFIEFLKDLGVEANAQLQHHAGQVLFAVTPTNAEDALEKIRIAFDVYLQLPSNPIGGTGLGSAIEIQKLNANIFHLQSQLSLANAIIHAKDAALLAQQTTIRVLTGEILVDSMKDVTPRPKEEDKEEVLGGMVALTTYKGKGFEIDLPELFRKLRSLFNKE